MKETSLELIEGALFFDAFSEPDDEANADFGRFIWFSFV